MAWVGGGWTITTCQDILCEHVNAWRIQELHTESGSPGPGGAEGEARPPGLKHHRPLRPLTAARRCERSAIRALRHARARWGHHHSAAAAKPGGAHRGTRTRHPGTGGRALAHACNAARVSAAPVPSPGSPQPHKAS